MIFARGSWKVRCTLTNTCRKNKEKNMEAKELKRIADIMQEILRLIKKDMEGIKKASK